MNEKGFYLVQFVDGRFQLLYPGQQMINVDAVEKSGKIVFNNQLYNAQFLAIAGVGGLEIDGTKYNYSTQALLVEPVETK